MCQLLGICANREVDINFSFREWRRRGDEKNPHGYGFAWWESNEWKIVKAASCLYQAAGKDIEKVKAARSQIFLAHVRFKSVGPQDGSNTHPFKAELGDKSFAFAHNGTVARIRERPLRRFQPEGTTDSEYAFLWMLERLEDVPDAEFAERLKQLGDEIRELGRFNFLMSDGRTVWAYADNSLHFIQRKPPYGGELVRLREDGYAISLSEVKGPQEVAVLIATEQLTDEAGWHRLDPGELLVVGHGRVRERRRE
jgi:glutamine amidotransferase